MFLLSSSGSFSLWHWGIWVGVRFDFFFFCRFINLLVVVVVYSLFRDRKRRKKGLLWQEEELQLKQMSHSHIHQRISYQIFLTALLVLLHGVSASPSLDSKLAFYKKTNYNDVIENKNCSFSVPS